VPDRLIVDLEADGQVAVSTWPDGGLQEPLSRALMTWPLDESAQEDLCWYLGEYLRAPFGVYEDRGPQVQQQIPLWGRQVFDAVFGTGPARDAYQRDCTTVYYQQIKNIENFWNVNVALSTG
jgi:hypothetical protein